MCCAVLCVCMWAFMCLCVHVLRIIESTLNGHVQLTLLYVQKSASLCPLDFSPKTGSCPLLYFVFFCFFQQGGADNGRRRGTAYCWAVATGKYASESRTHLVSLLATDESDIRLYDQFALSENPERKVLKLDDLGRITGGQVHAGFHVEDGVLVANEDFAVVYGEGRQAIARTRQIATPRRDGVGC